MEDDFKLYETVLHFYRPKTKSRLMIFYGMDIDREEAFYLARHEYPGWCLFLRTVKVNKTVREEEVYNIFGDEE